MSSAVPPIESRDFPFRFALHGAFLQIGALVTRDLAGGNADLRFQATVFPIEAEDDEGAAADRARTVKLVDLGAMEQQLSRPFRRRHFVARALVRLNIGVVEKRLAFFDSDESIADVRFTGANRFDLATFERDARFIALKDVKIAERFAIENVLGRHLGELTGTILWGKPSTRESFPS